MQNEWWKQPALQKSEAVLLPALERPSAGMPRFSDRFVHTRYIDERAFQPVESSWPEPLALSTYVRPRGSMAGRSVLRAVGHNPNRSMTRLRRRRW